MRGHGKSIRLCRRIEFIHPVAGFAGSTGDLYTASRPLLLAEAVSKRTLRSKTFEMGLRERPATTSARGAN